MSSKSPYEDRMWLNETLASGMVPYFHFVGAENGFAEDRRWQEVGVDYFQWTARHDAHFTTRARSPTSEWSSGRHAACSIPDRPPRASHPTCTKQPRASYDALLRGRFAFDFVHEDRLEPERLAKYRALLLPNVAMLSDKQCGQLRELRKGRRIAHGRI